MTPWEAKGEYYPLYHSFIAPDLGKELWFYYMVNG